jgi:hypothetical protein
MLQARVAGAIQSLENLEVGECGHGVLVRLGECAHATSRVGLCHPRSAQKRKNMKAQAPRLR